MIQILECLNSFADTVDRQSEIVSRNFTELRKTDSFKLLSFFIQDFEILNKKVIDCAIDITQP